jgi:hypothetical protein
MEKFQTWFNRKSTGKAYMEVSINGGTPIAGWFISWKIRLKWMTTGGTPILGTAQIFIGGIVVYKSRIYHDLSSISERYWDIFGQRICFGLEIGGTPK